MIKSEHYKNIFHSFILSFSSFLIQSYTDWVPYTVIVGFGAIFPDFIEGKNPKIIPHRTITHSILAWCFLTFLALLSPFWTEYRLPLLMFLVGGWSHLFADFLTITGVPLFYNSPRFALKLIKTGSFAESVIAWFIALVVFGFKYYFQKNWFLF